MSARPPVGSQADLDDRLQAFGELVAMTRRTLADLDAGEVHEMEQELADLLVLFRAVDCPVSSSTAKAFALGVEWMVAEVGSKGHQALLPCLARHTGRGTALSVMLMDRKGHR